MNLQAWRIVRETYAATAFDGEGARLYGGRWNTPGHRVIYTSATQSLAALESLVHLHPPVSVKLVAIPLTFPSTLLETLARARLPSDWRQNPAPPTVQRLGDQWLTESRSAILAVPSVIIPAETNYLLNPQHPAFKKIKLGKPIPFSFDPRLYNLAQPSPPA